MNRRTLALSAAALSACAALAAGVIGGASAHHGAGATGPTGPTGPHGPFERRRGGVPCDADVLAVVRDVRNAVAAKAPDIAAPVLDKAVSDGDVSRAQADRIASIVADKRLSRADARALFADPKAAPVFFEVKAALAREAPGIAKPIVDKAVDDDKLTRAQGDRLIAAAAGRGGGAPLGARGGVGVGGARPGGAPGFGAPAASTIRNKAVPGRE